MVLSLEVTEKLPEAGAELGAIQSPQSWVPEPIHCNGTDPGGVLGPKTQAQFLERPCPPNAQVAFW